MCEKCSIVTMCFGVPLGEVNDKNIQVVELPIVDSLHPRPPYLPLAVPEDLADRKSVV